MSADLIVSGAIATVGAGFFGLLRLRHRARADVEIARINADAERLRERIDEQDRTIQALRDEVARLMDRRAVNELAPPSSNP